MDGQQRLTALYGVIKGIQVVDKSFHPVPIRLAFHPLDQLFEVTNPAIKRNPEWLSNISDVWQPNHDLYTFINDFFERLSNKCKLSDEDRKRAAQSINRLANLKDYPLTALEISSSLSEEQVAEIFVRINSSGITLNRSDFILTLMSVFWDDGRTELETFARGSNIRPTDNRPSPYNPHFHPEPDQLLRVGVALGFRRARLETVYSLLRGKDLDTEQFSTQKRDEQFALLRQAQSEVLDLANWHEFCRVIQLAGYIHSNLITSHTALVYTYALWLIGKRDFKVKPSSLREITAQWIFMSSLTARYTSSPETRMDQDLTILRGISTADEFVNTWREQIASVLTRDYWEVTLPNELSTASARSTSQSAFYAAMSVLDAPVLYSRLTLRQLMNPNIHAKTTALERHHLFPRQYLKSIGIQHDHDINQVANYTPVEWQDNIDISGRPPAEYAREYEQRFSGDELARMYEFHGLFDDWYHVRYKQLLVERRRRMARVIQKGFQQLQRG